MLDQLVQEFLETFYQYNPTHATNDGFAGFDDKLPNFSKDHIDQSTKDYNGFLTRLAKIKPQTFDQEIDKELLERRLKQELFDIQSKQHQTINPAIYNDIASGSLFSLMMSGHHSDQEKRHYVCERLKQIPNFIKSAQENIHKPVTLWTKIALDEIPGTASYLKNVVLPFLKDQQTIGADEIVDLAHHQLFEFKHFLENLTETQDDFALGSDGFTFLLENFHGFQHSPEEVKKIGLSQIDLLTEQLNQQAEKIDSNQSWESLIDTLKKNHPSEENLLKAYINKMQEIKTFLIENEIVTLPENETLKVMETPLFLQNSIPYAAYCPPTMFAKSGQGLFFVSPVKGNKELLKDHCYASFPLTVLHEAYPGHHLQFATQRNLNSDIRKIYNVASYYEGWTLYCEEMMNRVGYYDDAMRLYQLKDRLWRAARIVVDVSMHCYGMSDQEAAQFLVDNAKLSQQGARVDVNWYTQMPTTPMSYLMGTLEVDRIREKFMGQGKSLREFHDAFLSCGAIPLQYVEKIILDKK